MWRRLGQIKKRVKELVRAGLQYEHKERSDGHHKLLFKKVRRSGGKQLIGQACLHGTGRKRVQEGLEKRASILFTVQAGFQAGAQSGDRGPKMHLAKKQRRGQENE